MEIRRATSPRDTPTMAAQQLGTPEKCAKALLQAGAISGTTWLDVCRIFDAVNFPLPDESGTLRVGFYRKL
jgi:hypothetical protein